MLCATAIMQQRSLQGGLFHSSPGYVLQEPHDQRINLQASSPRPLELSTLTEKVRRIMIHVGFGDGRQL